MKFEKKKITLPPAAWIGFALAAILFLFNGYTISKYVFQQKAEPLFVAKNFYFESDMLKASTETMPTYTLQTGVNSINFTIRNYPDDLRQSECEITYKVTCKSGEESKEQIGSFTTVKTSEEIKFEDLAAGTYTVTARATSPYTKTLQAKFVISAENNGIEYDVNDAVGSPTLNVVVRTADYSGAATFEWPNTVLPDNTDPLFETATGNSHTVKLESYSEYSFRFFKPDPSKKYTKNEITVVKSGE